MIRRFMLLCAVPMLLSSFTAKAFLNEDEIWKLMNANSKTITGARPDTPAIPGRDIVRLSMPFNESSWVTNTPEKIPAGTIIESVELVSTTYVSSPSFDQERLDRMRLHVLLKLMPSLAESSLTEWKRTHESGATNAEEGRRLFHGFIIIYRKPVTEASMKEEIKSITDMFGKIYSKTAEAPVAAKTAIDKKGKTYYKDTVSFDESGIIFGDVATPRPLHGIIYTSPTPLLFPAAIPTQDSTVTAVLNRNRQWKEMLVVCDITGSMSPYTSQLLAWFKLNTLNNKVKNFVFFNDGDMKPDAQKVAGATGGIYAVSASTFDTVMATAIHAMQKGYGGDCPENNVEAVTYGLTNYGDAKEIVMIADNWATPRDLALAGNITRPVRIIVCGGYWGINPAYLDLARKTGGSVHTMEKDLTDLATLHDGETITIGKFIYKLQDGKFISVSKL